MKEDSQGKPSAGLGRRLSSCVKDSIPGALKTMWWVIRITAIVSVIIYILRLTGVLPILGRSLEPVMSFIGLPGEASLAYVSGYFVNVYSAIAASASLNLSARSVTILAVLVLCSHNMIVETAVQKKTGSSALWIVLERTFGGLFLAFVLNRILPAEEQGRIGTVVNEQITLASSIGPWALSLLKLCLKMSVLILLLSIIQQILNEFGIMKVLTDIIRWPLKLFGLPSDTSFLWIVANTLGLAYGAAVMFQEKEKGRISQRDIQLLNTHICISHSNIEDLVLFVSVGGIWWVILLSRWALSLLLVWIQRLVFHIRDRFTKFAG